MLVSIGAVFGKLRLVGVIRMDQKRNRYWECLCECGNTTSVRQDHLVRGKIVSCGCFIRAKLSVIKGANYEAGACIGGYIVLARAPRKSARHRSQFYEVFDAETGEILIKTTHELRYRKSMYRRLFSLISCKARYYKIELPRDRMRLLGMPLSEAIVYLGDPPGNGYDLDHICPVKQAKNRDEFLALMDVRNLRWCPRTQNKSKGFSGTEEACEMCRLLLGREWEEVRRRDYFR